MPPRDLDDQVVVRRLTAIRELVDLTGEWEDQLIEAGEGKVALWHTGWRLIDGERRLPESWWAAAVGRVRAVNTGLSAYWAD